MKNKVIKYDLVSITPVNLNKLNTVLSFLIPEFQKCCLHTVLSEKLTPEIWK